MLIMYCCVAVAARQQRQEHVSPEEARICSQLVIVIVFYCRGVSIFATVVFYCCLFFLSATRLTVSNTKDATIQEEGGARRTETRRAERKAVEFGRPGIL